MGSARREHPQYKVAQGSGFGSAYGLKERDRAVDAILSAGERVAPGTGVPSASEPAQPVYDIVNCGPRRRFVVKGDVAPFIVHNCTQGLCRDVLRDGWIALHKAGYAVLWTIHDEFVIELPESENTPAGLERLRAVILDVPGWAKFIPLDVGMSVSAHYTK